MTNFEKKRASFFRKKEEEGHGALERCLNGLDSKFQQSPKDILTSETAIFGSLFAYYLVKFLQEIYFLMISPLKKTLIVVTSPVTLCSNL